jgi:hypothetical protein
MVVEKQSKYSAEELYDAIDEILNDAAENLTIDEFKEYVSGIDEIAAIKELGKNKMATAMLGSILAEVYGKLGPLADMVNTNLIAGCVAMAYVIGLEGVESNE